MKDASIVELLRRRDERAITELKEKYGRLCMYTAGKILAQREDAEECVSSAFYDIWTKIPPDDPEDLKTYLCRIVRNKAIDKLKYNKAAKRDPQLSVSLDELAECIPDSRGTEPSVGELAGLISSFLRTQDEKQRNIFIRRYWYGNSLSEIAVMFDINERTAATNLFRMRKKLKEYLKKEGYENG